MAATPQIARDLIALLRLLPPSEEEARLEDACATVDQWPLLLEASFEHAVAGVLLTAFGSGKGHARSVDLAPAQRRARFEAVRQDAFRRALHRILDILAREGVPGVALKGPLLAARLYAGVVRPSTDLDILVEPASLDGTVRALGGLGYRLEGGEIGLFFRNHHHHVHLLHQTLPMLEIHIAAYQGFGASIPAAPLLARSVRCQIPEWYDARVLAPEDEFVYLSVHAASHRFQRLGWLFDLKLFVLRHPNLRWDLVAERAAGYGFTVAVRLACTLLVDWLGVKDSWGALLPPLGTARLRAVERLLPARSSHATNAAASFLYSALVCDNPIRLAAYAGRFLRVKALHELPMRIRSRAH